MIVHRLRIPANLIDATNDVDHVVTGFVMQGERQPFPFPADRLTLSRRQITQRPAQQRTGERTDEYGHGVQCDVHQHQRFPASRIHHDVFADAYHRRQASLRNGAESQYRHSQQTSEQQYQRCAERQQATGLTAHHDQPAPRRRLPCREQQYSRFADAEHYMANRIRANRPKRAFVHYKNDQHPYEQDPHHKNKHIIV